jgi:hypothetical protein
MKKKCLVVLFLGIAVTVPSCVGAQIVPKYGIGTWTQFKITLLRVTSWTNSPPLKKRTSVGRVSVSLKTT